jgi:1-phosphatidylinositol-4-phosphate 5-kinase
LCSTGKSGSFFYFSYDSKFVLKTISVGEFEYFKLILEDYYFHMQNNPNTLLQRFFGLHTLIFNETKLHLVIMNNVFITDLKVHIKYDLKGSSYQRLSRKKADIDYSDYDFNIPLKDLDFRDRKEQILLLPQEKMDIIDELNKDANFLASKNINDYSFLIGIHDKEYEKDEETSHKKNVTNLMFRTSNSKSITFDFINPIILNNSSQKEKPTSIARHPFYENHSKGMLSSDGRKVYFFGVIDIFTQYAYNIFNNIFLL